ncbi:MAG: OmpA family protein [Bacteroidia bacterium]|nr:OmpA family protein [Bacteroidia bacterium]
MHLATRLRHFGLCFILLSVFQLSFGQKPKPADFGIKSKKALKYYFEGLQYDQYRDRGKAMAAYEEALLIEPEFADAHYRLGSDLYVLKSYEDALPHLEKALDLSPDKFPNANFLLGEANFFNENYETSLKFLQEFVNRGKGRRQDLEIAESRLRHAIYSAFAIKDSFDFSPQNLGPKVNSIGNETHPFLTADGSTLLFTGKRPGSTPGRPNEDLFLCEYVDEDFEEAKNVGKVINDRLNQGAASITQDGRTVIFTSCNKEGGFGSCDLYMSTREGNKWSEPVNLGPNVNTKFWESYPMLSDDGQTLFFASRRINGMGNSDIWYCTKDGDGWSPAKNMGAPINSPGEEAAPFLHADGESFYFASTYHPGFGNSDIFVSFKQEDGSWAEPKNLGYPLNSSGEDQGLYIAVNGKRAFFSSTREGGYGGADLYEFELPESARPKIATFLRGKVQDSLTSKSLAASIRLIDVESGDTVRQVSSDKISGQFLASLPLERQYAAYVEAKGYLFKTQTFFLKNLEEEAYFDILVELVPLRAGKQVVLNNIFFASGSFQLEKTSDVELNFLYNFMKKYPRLRIEIQGHTDNVGSPQSNLTLSQNRAEAVRSYLIKMGIKPARIVAKGYGETQPVAGNITDEDRARNRRTEFKILTVK